VPSADPDHVQHHGRLSTGERIGAVEDWRRRVYAGELRAVVNRLEGNGTSRGRPVEWIAARESRQLSPGGERPRWWASDA